MKKIFSALLNREWSGIKRAMGPESMKLHIVLILAVGLGLAGLLGYIAHRVKLSPILGFLLAGYLIGPYSPGFVADSQTAEQLAEIGVILMMFGVGLNFQLEELMQVKKIAVPGALVQTTVAILLAFALFYLSGWSVESGVLTGMAIGVSSTVVLVRMLEDNFLVKSVEGHIALGWTVVEDLITVGMLVLLPDLVPLLKGGAFSLSEALISVLFIGFKVSLLFVGMFTVGQHAVSFTLSKVRDSKSDELFTLTLLALTFLIAIGSSYLFGTSIALGAFIAGMVIGRTHLKKQAVFHSQSIKSAFVAVFFVSVGMIFNPDAIIKTPWLFLGLSAIVLVFKPIAGFLFLRLCHYPTASALLVAAVLAQIGEFSFILSEEALKYGLLPDDGYDLIVACALLTITLNPMLVSWAKKKPPHQERLFHHNSDKSKA